MFGKDRYGHSCETCLNYQFDKERKRLRCVFRDEKQDTCYNVQTDKFVSWQADNPLSLGKYACLKSQKIFDALKAKIFNVLEAQLPIEPNDRRLRAVKNITEDILGTITEEVKEAILNSEVKNKTIDII